MPSVITDLDEIARLAAQRRDEFEVMRYLLELDDNIDDAALDRLVETVAAPIIAAIDCTQCGNCCRSLDAYVTSNDVDRLAEGLDQSREQVMRRIDREGAAAEGEWGRMCRRPCPFLNDCRCSVYAHRPEACRIYPQFTPDFRWTLADTIDGAATCPIIYNVLSAMVERIDQVYGAAGQGSPHRLQVFYESSRNSSSGQPV